MSMARRSVWPSMASPSASGTASLTKKPEPRRGSTSPRATSSSKAETTVFLP